MVVWEWMRFLIGGGLLLCGLGTFIIEMIGVFRFRYVLNRMHAAAIGDTLGIGFALLGLIVISGLNFTSLKLFLVIVFLWFSSPVSSHLIARLEVSTNEESGKHYRVINLDALESQAEAIETESSKEHYPVTGSEAPESSAEDNKTGNVRAEESAKKPNDQGSRMAVEEAEGQRRQKL